MNSNLANQLLASIMKWDPQTLASERAALEFMGSMKYDAYDRYMPGMRFMSSLVQWLNDIDEEDRDEAFKFVKERLVFISSIQMNYLVDLLYDSKIRPVLLDMATTEIGMASYMRSNKKVRQQFDIEKRSSLVIGLSDGRIQIFCGAAPSSIMSRCLPTTILTERSCKICWMNCVVMTNCQESPPLSLDEFS